jgi:hypothetical protein
MTWHPRSEEDVRVAGRHAVATARLVESVASPAHRPHAHAAALLQDIGRLVCLARQSDHGGDSGSGTREDPVPFQDIGVELLHLWGLPPAVVAAVAARDVPHLPAASGLGVTGALRAAHLLIQQTESRDPWDGTHTDELRLLLTHPQMVATGTDWAAAAEHASAHAHWLAR